MRPTRLLPPGLSMLPLALLLAQAGVAPVQAQTRSSSLSASVDTRLSYNVNSRLGGLDGAEWVGEILPSLSLQSRSGRVIGSLDYALGLLRRSRGEPSSEAVSRLASRFSAEAVPGHLYLEGSAAIAEQSTSPFGLQSDGSSRFSNPNRSEVGTAALSPVLRGVIGGAVAAEARLEVATSDTRGTSVGDSTQTGGSLSLSALIPGTLVNWGLTAQTGQTHFRIGRTTRTEAATATLGWQADADLLLTLRGGTETQNVQELESRRTSTWGVGANWRPSPRTRLQLNADDRYFGRGHGVVAEYRLPRTSFTAISTRDTSHGNGGNVEPQTQFQQFMALYATDFPDPAEREVVVRGLLSTLGLDPLSLARPGFVISSVSVTERHSLSWAWAGQRLAFGAQASRSSVTAIDTALTAVAREPVRQTDFSANVSYRLTPTRNLLAIASRQLTKATATQASNALSSASLTWTEQLGHRTSVSLSARYTVFRSATDPYREAALAASLLMRF